MKLLEVVEFLLQEEQVSPDDVIDVFRGGKTARVKQKKWDTLPIYPTKKRKVLKTKKLVQFALADLVVPGVVQEAQANANMQTWNYFVK
ncbi:hypothetical protein RhiirA1_463707 [Rhizophagus irregularis]|uniref:Uncharacterized protein n=1 Tax=Rhizophagus irregularis TaxID=588596 RepID=A0A2N0RJJ2_9GLOM|nr:hypothetical protein RhiirA1_463707 [Rhizophagus irregularis]